MLTREEVIAAYRLILGREPESEQMIQCYLNNIEDTTALRREFLNSAEFKRNAGKVLHGLGGPMDVQVHCRPHELGMLLRHIELAWGRMGEEEPMFSVLTDERFKPENFSAHSVRFFQSGKCDVDRFITTLRRNNISFSSIDSCLEFGCGVGRVTRSLATIFPTVIACDISEPHIKIARDYLKKEDIHNVHMIHSSSIDVIENITQVDCIFSVLVLQHNPPPIIAKMIEILLNKLRPGGIAYFQLPTYQIGYSFDVPTYLNSSLFAEKNMELHVLPQKDVFQLISDSNCSTLEILEDDLIGETEFVSNTLLVRKEGDLGSGAGSLFSRVAAKLGVNFG